MRKIKEVLRLHFESGLSERQISNICVLGKGTVRRFLKRAERAGLSWPLPPGLEDAGLEKQLFPPPPPGRPLGQAGQRPQPDYAIIHKELKGPECHAATALGGVQTAASGRVQLQPPQRTLQRMVQAPGLGSAPGPWRRRKDVRRSRQPDRSGHRPAHGRNTGSLCVCGGAGRQ